MPSYPLVLLVVSLVVLGAETLWPLRKQKRLRRGLSSDLCFLVFNGHFQGVFLYWVFQRFVAPPLDHALVTTRLAPLVNHGFAGSWPLWLQVVVVIVVMDFVQWCAHRVLHRVPWLWAFHQVHHSVVDGEMDFLVSFRFHWVEAVFYKTLQYLPLAFFGFSTTAVFVQACVGTLVGHLSHGNLDFGKGPLRFVLNTPRMHLWHHDRDLVDGGARNFGIVFSAWDWIFGTAYLPPEPPRALGFPGVERMPENFVAREIWPLWRRQGVR